MVAVSEDPDGATTGPGPEENRDYLDRDLFSLTSQQERREAYNEAVFRGNLSLIRAAYYIGLGALIVLALLGLFILWTFVVHMFVPYWGWLDTDQQSRLTSWYASLTPAAFPLLIINSWLVWYATKTKAARDESASR